MAGVGAVGGEVADAGGAGHPGAALPVVGGGVGGKDWWEGEHEVGGEGGEEGVVHGPELGEAGFGFGREGGGEAGVVEEALEAGAFGSGKAVGVGGVRGDLEDECDVDGGVARHGEGELCLEGVACGAGGDEEGAGVEYGGECGEPGLVGVLGAVIGEDGERDMAFEKLGAPLLPLAEGGVGVVGAAGASESGEEFAAGRGGAGAGVEEGDGGLAAGEGLVEDGEIADDDGEEGEAEACFEGGEGACEKADGADVAEAEGEEGGAAEVDVGSEAEVGRGGVAGGEELGFE